MTSCGCKVNSCAVPNSKCCDANVASCCKTLGGILNNDQGYYQNVTTNKITNIPLVDLAFISNCDNGFDSDSIIGLNPIFLTWSDFSTLFFRGPSGSFYISPSNTTTPALALSSQTYESTQNKKIVYSLYDQLSKAWAKKHNKNVNAIPIPYKIQLERQSFLIKSLNDVTCYQLGLSLDEAISSLISTNQIAPASYDSCATVKFTINFRNYFCPLDIAVTTVFTYVTNIPCYENVVTSDCNYYSKDTNQVRKVFNCEDDNSFGHDDDSSSNSSGSSSSSGSGGQTIFEIDNATSCSPNMSSVMEELDSTVMSGWSSAYTSTQTGNN